MKKHIYIGLLLSFLSAFYNMAIAQSFQGLRSSLRPGHISYLTNPALLFDTTSRWEVNLMAANVFAGGNHTDLRWKNIGHLTANLLKDQWVSRSQYSDIYGSMDLLGPSFSFQTMTKGRFSITTRSRVFMQGYHLDGRIISEIDDHGIEKVSHPYALQNEDMILQATAFNELGLSWAGSVVKAGPHRVTAGLTVKYISGAALARLSVQHLSGTVKYDNADRNGYLTNAQGIMTIDESGSFFDHPHMGDLLHKGKGSLGADIGFVYEYDPENNNRDRSGTPSYKWKFGLSIMDIGVARFATDSSYSRNYQISVPDGQDFYFKNTFTTKDISEVGKTLDAYPQFFKRQPYSQAVKRYVLPAGLHLFADYNFGNHLFVNFEAQKFFHGQNASDVIYAPDVYTFTGRYETQKWGIFIPISVQTISKWQAGLALRYQCFFIGSGSVLNAAFNHRQLDGYFGIFLQGKEKSKS